MSGSESEHSYQDCRICLDEDNNYLSIQDPFEGEKIGNLLKELTGQMILIDSSISNYVCSTCTATLSLAVTFRRNVLSAEQRIRSALLDGLTIPVPSGALDVKPETDGEESVPTEILDASDNSGLERMDYDQDTHETLSDVSLLTIKEETSAKQQAQDDSDDFTVEFVVDEKKFDACRVRKPPRKSTLTGVKRKRVHKAALNIPKEDLERACCMCKFVAESVEALMEHVETHLERLANIDKNRVLDSKAMKESNPDSKYCPLCQKFFASSSHCMSHRQYLYLRRSCVCDRCGRGFANNTILKYHYQTHTGEVVKKKTYRTRATRNKEPTEELKCKICKKQFYYLGALRQHATSHAEVAEYPCELCEKKFFSKANLKIHMRVHLNIRPYSCPYCDKTFIHSTDRNRHVKVHTGERPHKCLICGHSYIKKYDLTQHMLKNHPLDKPYSCSACNESFIHESEAKRHIELEH